MDSEDRLTQVIAAMQSDIRKLQLENLGLRRRAGTGASLRKNATAPVLLAECRDTLSESVVMTVRRYSVFQPFVNHRNLRPVHAKRLTGDQRHSE